MLCLKVVWKVPPLPMGLGPPLVLSSLRIRCVTELRSFSFVATYGQSKTVFRGRALLGWMQHAGRASRWLSAPGMSLARWAAAAAAREGLDLTHLPPGPGLCVPACLLGGEGPGAGKGQRVPEAPKPLCSIRRAQAGCITLAGDEDFLRSGKIKTLKAALGCCLPSRGAGAELACRLVIS